MRRNRFVTRLIAALVAATPAVALTVASGAVPRPAAVPATWGPATALQTFPLARPDGLRLASSGGEHTAHLPRTPTGLFSLVGATWSDPRAVAGGRIEVRTRAAGTVTWTPWQLLETDSPEASAGAEGPWVRGASDPLWVGPSDGVQARAAGSRALPDGLRIDLINPDAPSPEPVLLPAVARRGAGTAARNPGLPAGQVPAAARRGAGTAARNPDLPARPVPAMVTRSGWGANEAIVKGAPGYTGSIEVVFVHHTATGNDYVCTESAGIVRGIAAYQVKSKGWNDVGYNFLVDKCGNVFEGRRGGAHRSVLGAHTLGFNDNSSAIVVIGDHRSTPITPAARASVAQLAAYKLGAWGNPPAGRAAVVSGGGNRFPAGKTANLDRISGHRDAGATECPGDSLYAQLPSIRTLAGGAPAGLRYQELTGASVYAGTYYTRGLVRPLWDLSTPTRMMDRFEVWLDGRLFTAAPAGNRVARLQLSPGAHTVVVKAVHLSGRTSVTTARVLADAVPPAFVGEPQVTLRPGTLDEGVPVRVGWAASDANGLRSVRVAGSDRAVLSASARMLDTSARLGETGAWTVTAADRAGNVRSASVTRTPVLLPEAEAKRTGTWRTLRDPGHLGSEAAAGSTPGASLSWTFTGRSAAVVVGRGATSGRIRIHLDGRDQGVVDLQSASTTYRQAVWTRMWQESGRHTVRVQVEGTTGRPSVTLDGLAYLR